MSTVIIHIIFDHFPIQCTDSSGRTFIINHNIIKSKNIVNTNMLLERCNRKETIKWLKESSVKWFIYINNSFSLNVKFVEFQYFLALLFKCVFQIFSQLNHRVYAYSVYQDLKDEGGVELHLSGKELSFCHKLGFSNFNIVATQCRRPLIFQTMNVIRSNNVCLKYQRFTS